jgi:hypothetical protein
MLCHHKHNLAEMNYTIGAEFEKGKVCAWPSFASVGPLEAQDKTSSFASVLPRISSFAPVVFFSFVSVLLQFCYCEAP